MTDQTPTEQYWQRRRPIRRWLVILVLFALIVAVIFAIRNAPKQIKLNLFNAQPGLVRVIRIDDGDTIRVSLNGKEETVRFIGVDTPEVKDPRKPVQCYGPEASKYTKSRLSGQSVRLVADPLDSDRDKYQRLLRYVYLSDGTDYNAELIRQGYGFAYVVFPYAQLQHYQLLQTAAKQAKAGLWSVCSVNESTLIKQTNPIP